MSDFDEPTHRIKYSVLGNGKVVSTVQLHFPHSESLGYEFETMVFPSTKDYNDLEMDRYLSLEDALEGHERMVQKHEGNLDYIKRIRSWWNEPVRKRKKS